ncbi:MAG TPA: hypothetical protein VMJ34_18145 [Bryobacteraceae bacterium]|nr:hypothetical protein [Bryobacteraceae bacterium]
MKWFQTIGLSTLALFAIVGVAAGDAPSPKVAAVQTVYILPMSSGMDQYLASRLTAMNVVQVSTDPQTADAIFTDRLGESFERRFGDLYPKPAPPKAEAKEKEGDKGDSNVAAQAELAEKGQASAPVSSFGRGKGNIFLVDRKTRAVIWSTYEKPEGTRPEQLKHTADVIAKQFKDARKPAK